MDTIYYDTIAEGYAELYGEEQKKKMEIIKSHMKVSAKSKILDLGCGTGISTDFACNCIGIDPSKNLIAIAKRNDRSPNHSYIVEAAENLHNMHYGLKEFDYVLCISAVHHITNLESVLAEIRKIGKEFIVTVVRKSEKGEKIRKLIRKYFKENLIIEEEKDTIIFCS